MDQASFDRLARALGRAGSRRRALGALLGAGLTGVGTATAKKARRKGGEPERAASRAGLRQPGRMRQPSRL